MTNEVATTQPKPEIVKFREQLEQRASEIAMALPQHITQEKFQRTIITAAQSDPELLKADRQSLVLACMKAAQDGLLPDKRESAIVVFKENKKTDEGWQTRLIATYMPMVYGLRKKILQSGDVVALEVNVVYRAEVDAGKFLYEVGLNPPLRHRPMLELSEEQTQDSEIVAAYSIATMKDGTKSYELMRRFEIDKVRETSKTGATRDRNGKPRQAFGPWVDWFAEMAKKTVMRRHAKTLPQSGDIIIDIEGREHEAALSTARLLQQQPDAPRIEHHEDDEELPAHDNETGELDDELIIDVPEGAEVSAEDMARAYKVIIGGKVVKNRNGPVDEPEKEKKPRAPRKAKEKPEPEMKEPESSTEQDDAAAKSSGEATAEEAEQEALEAGAEPAEPESILDDADTDAINDFQIVADDLLTSFKNASTIVDLKRLYDDSEESRGQMPEHISSAIESGYQRERRRLQGNG